MIESEALSLTTAPQEEDHSKQAQEGTGRLRNEKGGLEGVGGILPDEGAPKARPVKVHGGVGGRWSRIGRYDGLPIREIHADRVVESGVRDGRAIVESNSDAG